MKKCINELIIGMKNLKNKNRKYPIKNLVELKQFWGNFDTAHYYKYLLAIQ